MLNAKPGWCMQFSHDFVWTADVACESSKAACNRQLNSLAGSTEMPGSSTPTLSGTTCAQPVYDSLCFAWQRWNHIVVTSKRSASISPGMCGCRCLWLSVGWQVGFQKPNISFSQKIAFNPESFSGIALWCFLLDWSWGTGNGLWGN